MQKKSADKNKTHIAALDGLRGIAILIILANHSVITYFTVYPEQGNNYDLITNFILKIFSLLWSGVDLFFVLSGFLITKILLDSKGAINYFKAFYVRRVLRIFPLYYSALCLHFFFIAPALLETGIPEKLTGYDNQLYYWFYLANFVRQPNILSHLWSLAVEEQFYLFWPFFVYFLSREKLVWTCGLLIGFSLLSRFLLCMIGDFSYAYSMTYSRIDPIIMGSLVAILKPKVSTRQLKTIVTCSLLLVMLLYSNFLFDFSRPLFYPFSTEERILYTTFRHFLFGVLFTALLMMAMQSEPQKLFHKICTSKTAILFGKFSYSIYIFHVFIVFIILESPLNFKNVQEIVGIPMVAFIWQFVLCSLLSLLVSAFTWYCIEVHFLRLKKFFVCQFEKANSPPVSG